MLSGEVAHQQEYIVAGFRVEVAGWFVGNQQQRFVEQGAGKHHALLFAARKLKRHGCLFIGQPYFRQHLFDALADGGFIVPARCAQDETQIFRHIPIGEQVKILENNAEFATQQVDIAA